MYVEESTKIQDTTPFARVIALAEVSDAEAYTRLSRHTIMIFQGVHHNRKSIEWNKNIATGYGVGNGVFLRLNVSVCAW